MESDGQVVGRRLKEFWRVAMGLGEMDHLERLFSCSTQPRGGRQWAVR